MYPPEPDRDGCQGDADDDNDDDNYVCKTLAL